MCMEILWWQCVRILLVWLYSCLWIKCIDIFLGKSLTVILFHHVISAFHIKTQKSQLCFLGGNTRYMYLIWYRFFPLNQVSLEWMLDWCFDSKGSWNRWSDVSLPYVAEKHRMTFGGWKASRDISLLNAAWHMTQWLTSSIPLPMFHYTYNTCTTIITICFSGLYLRFGMSSSSLVLPFSKNRHYRRGVG